MSRKKKVRAGQQPKPARPAMAKRKPSGTRLKRSSVRAKVEARSTMRRMKGRKARKSKRTTSPVQFAATPSRRSAGPVRKGAAKRKAVILKGLRNSLRKQGRGKTVLQSKRRASAQFKKRSRAAKKGWITRRKNERAEKRRKKRETTPGPQEPIITRRQYKGQHGKVTHIEIVSVGSEIKKITVGKNEYTNKKDLTSFVGLLAASSLVVD